MKRPLLIVGAMFSMVGVIATAIGLVLLTQSLTFRAAATSTQGTIVDVVGGTDCDNDGCSETYAPVVRFSTGAGRQVTIRPNYSTSARPSVGSTVTVLYRPDDPAGARIDGFMGFWFGPVLVGGLGILFAAIGLPMLIVELRRIRVHAWLRANGTRVTATVIDIAPNYRVRINRRHPWQVHLRWTDPMTGRQHRFVSENLLRDPTPEFVGRNTGEVLIDPQDPGRRYLVDLE